MSFDETAAIAATSEVALEPAVAVSGGPALLLARRLVLAWAHPCPAGEVRRGREAAHVDPDLADDRLGEATIDARNRAETVPGLSKRGDRLLDGGGHPSDRLVEVVKMGEDL